MYIGNKRQYFNLQHCTVYTILTRAHLTIMKMILDGTFTRCKSNNSNLQPFAFHTIQRYADTTQRRSMNSRLGESNSSKYSTTSIIYYSL